MTLLLLVACESPPKPAACTPLAEIEVTNPDGMAPATPEADVPWYVGLVVEQFAEQTTRESVCVDEVRLVPWPDHPEGPELPVDWQGAAIEVAYDERGWLYLANALRHGLCHAFDAEAGSLSDARPDLFGDVGDEAFAEACALGPAPYVIEEAVEAACDIDLDGARRRFLNEEVFDAVVYGDVGPGGAATVDVTPRRDVALDEDLVWRAVPSGDRVWLLGWTLAVETPPILIGLDPATGEETARYEASELDGNVTVLSTVEGPPALVPRQGVGTGWRIDGDGQEQTFPVPDLIYVSGGAVVGDAAWLTGAMWMDAEHGYPFARLDLRTGEVEALLFPDGVIGWTPRPGPDGVLEGGASLEDGSGGWLTYDPATEAFTVTALPARFRNVVALGDDRLLAQWEVGEDPDRFGGLAIVDLETGTWSMTDDPCVADVLDAGAQLVSVNGEAYVWSYAGDGTLAKVEIE